MSAELWIDGEFFGELLPSEFVFHPTMGETLYLYGDEPLPIAMTNPDKELLIEVAPRFIHALSGAEMAEVVVKRADGVWRWRFVGLSSPAQSGWYRVENVEIEPEELEQ